MRFIPRHSFSTFQITRWCFTVLHSGAVAVTGPDNVVSKRGSNVTLTCSFDRDCNSVAWNYKDKPIYIRVVGFLGSFEHRSSIVNSTTPGSCTSRVTISDLKLEDSGTYSCTGITSDYTSFVKKADLVVVGVYSCLFKFYYCMIIQQIILQMR